MAYKNFIPEIWSEAINRDLERLHVFADGTNREYEGEVSQKGDSVRILGVGKPTVIEVEKESFAGLADPETVEDTAIIMPINRMAYFNYKVDDIDKRQAVGGVMEALSAETSEALADVQDRYIASLAAAKECVNVYPSATQITANNVLDVLLEAHQRLYENDVKANTQVEVIVTPAVATLYKKALAIKDTDNSKLLKNGVIDRFDGMNIKVSNNVYQARVGANTVQHIQVRTNRAIAFARPMVHTEAYRPEKAFSDAVKGFILYGAKIVRPKEMFNLNVYL